MGRYQVTAREAVTSTVAGITLVAGKATVDDDTSADRLALAYFRRKGYRVEAETPDLEPAADPTAPVPPSRSASTDAWRAYAVEHGGMTAEEAAALSRDNLAERYLGPKEA